MSWLVRTTWRSSFNVMMTFWSSFFLDNNTHKLSLKKLFGANEFFHFFISFFAGFLDEKVWRYTTSIDIWIDYL